MLGLKFLISIRNISQKAIADAFGISVQAVNAWVRQVKPIPDKYKEPLAQWLGVHPAFLDKELSLEDMVFILTGSLLQNREDHFSISFSVLKDMCKKQQQQIEVLNEKLEVAKQKLQKIEKEAEEIWKCASKLQKYLHVIEDEFIQKTAKLIWKKADLVLNTVRELDHLVYGSLSRQKYTEKEIE